MVMGNKTNHPGQTIISISSRSFADIITHDKIHRHLRDINDTISEEDIRNVRTGIWLRGDIVNGREDKFSNYEAPEKETA